MDLMKNWISPLVQKALYNAIENPRDPIRSRAEFISPGYDDNSTFRIPVETKRCAQLIKVYSHV